jgi:hypothetical protein
MLRESQIELFSTALRYLMWLQEGFERLFDSFFKLRALISPDTKAMVARVLNVPSIFGDMLD